MLLLNVRGVGLGFVVYIQPAQKSADKTIACRFVSNKVPRQMEQERVLRVSAYG
jgi:hypothetical protein